MRAEKEFLYIGYYIDTEGEVVLKIGTTNDLKRRRYEHNTNYRKSPNCTMPRENTFEYLWKLPLSKYNTVRYEDKNRQRWKDAGIGKFVEKDRFVIPRNLTEVTIQIRKTYTIPLSF